MSDPLRLLVYFRGRVGDNQGTPLRCRNMTRAMARLDGVEVALVSRDTSREATALLPGVRHFPVPEPAAGAGVLRTAARELAPHVAYAHTHKGMADLARVETGGLRAVDLHGDLPAWRLEHEGRTWLWRRYWHLRERLRERRNLPAIDAFTVVSAPLERRTTALGKPTLRLWGGVDPDLFATSDPPTGDGPLIAYAGNFNPYHGLGTVLSAAALARREIPDLRLRLIGDAAAYPATAERARQELGEGVELTGRVPYAEVPKLLSEAHVLVIPRARSRTAETTYPSKLSEYLATGRPVVAAAVGEVGEVIRDGDNGLLVEPEDPAAMAAAFTRLTDRALRQRIGTAGRETACRELSWTRVASRAIDFFQHCLERSTSAA